MTKNTMEELKEKYKGAHIKNIYVNETKEKGYTLYDLTDLLLETDKGNLCISVSGDCCSTGYIDHVGLDLWSEGNRIIKEFIEIEMPKDLQLANTSQDVDAIYGLRIDLKEGAIFIEYRNSSNGYYGSWYDLYEREDLQGYNLLESSFYHVTK